MNNRQYKTGDLVVVVDDTNKVHIGKLAKFVGYNDGIIYDSKFRYIVKVFGNIETAVIEIRPLTLLEIELNS